MDQFLINYDQFQSIMINLNQFLIFMRKNSVGIVNLTFLHQSNTHVVCVLKLMKINLTIQINL